jgi:hypothetical protein
MPDANIWLLAYQKFLLLARGMMPPQRSDKRGDANGQVLRGCAVLVDTLGAFPFLACHLMLRRNITALPRRFRELAEGVAVVESTFGCCGLHLQPPLPELIGYRNRLAEGRRREDNGVIVVAFQTHIADAALASRYSREAQDSASIQTMPAASARKAHAAMNGARRRQGFMIRTITGARPPVASDELRT